jgi:hypothetical protein
VLKGKELLTGGVWTPSYKNCGTVADSIAQSHPSAADSRSRSQEMFRPLWKQNMSKVKRLSKNRVRWRCFTDALCS